MNPQTKQPMVNFEKPLEEQPLVIVEKPLEEQSLAIVEKPIDVVAPNKKLQDDTKTCNGDNNTK